MNIETAVEKVRAFYKEDIANRHPFEGHPLEDYEDYIKDLYLTMLAAIMQYENTPLHEQKVFLERITKGVHAQLEVGKYVQKAVTMDESFAKDFYDNLKDQPIVMNFVLDALVLVHCRMSGNQKQLAFLAEVIDIFGYDIKELEALILLAKAILSRDYRGFANAIVISPRLDMLDQIEYYSHFEYEKGAPVIRNANTFEILDLFASEEKNIYIKDCIIDLSSLKDRLLVQNKTQLIFKNCIIKGKDAPITFINIGSILFEHCEVSGFQQGTFEMIAVAEVAILNSQFRNCSRSHNSIAYGGIIQNHDELELSIIDSMFVNNFTRLIDNNWGANGAVFSGPIRNYYIIDNIFEDCYTDGTMDKRSLVRIWHTENGIDFDYNLMSESLRNESEFYTSVKVKQYIEEKKDIYLLDNLEFGNKLKNCNCELIIQSNDEWS